MNGAAPERPVWHEAVEPAAPAVDRGDEPPEPEPLPPLDTVDDPWRGDAPPAAHRDPYPGPGAFGDAPPDIRHQQQSAVPPPEYVVPERPAAPPVPDSPPAAGPADHGPAPEYAPPPHQGRQIGPYSVPPSPQAPQQPYPGQHGPGQQGPDHQGQSGPQGGQWQGGPQQGQAPQGYQQHGPPPGARQPYPQQPLSGPQQPYSQYPQQGAAPQSLVPGFAQSGPQPPFNPADPQRPNWPENVDSLKPESLVRTRKPAPSKGWRKVVHTATFGVVHPGESQAELRRRELVSRARTHVAGGHHRVAVLSLKGGVGKTTTTVALGSTLSSLRGDRVLAVDANPDRGTLSDKVRLETAATIRDLLNEKDTIRRYADIRGFTSQAISRLEILASDRDPAVSEAFSEDDYREVSRLLEHYYSICLTDCGTGLLHSAMRGVLGLADQTVLVSTASVDGARSASATLDWLEAHEFGYLVRGAVVVLSMVRADGKSSIDLGRLEEHFASRCRAVVRIPWDTHLEEGAEVTLENLHANTRDAYLQLAATVGEAFAWPR
nr:MinD/ParA family protein [Murinocardiopsis flavida]